MWDRLTRTTAPASDPVTLTEAKAALRVDGVDEDTYIGSLIDRATEVIDGPNGIGICLVSQVWKLTLDAFPACIRIPLGPVISVDEVAYTDTDGGAQTLTVNTDYRVMNAGGRVIVEPAYGKSWPSTRPVAGAVTVTFTAGHSTVPEKLKHIVLMLVALWHEQRIPVADLREMPWGVSDLIAQHRVGTVA